MTVGIVIRLRNGRPMGIGSIGGRERIFSFFQSIHLIFSGGLGCLNGWSLKLTTQSISRRPEEKMAI